MRRALWVSLGLVALLVLSAGVASADLGDRVLSLGARGDDVAELQRGLAALGYPVPATGNYGALTRRAVAAFQAQAGLPVTGQADVPTIKEMEGWLAELGTSPGGEYEGFSLPYGEGYGPYAAPRAPYPGGTDSPFGPGTYGWGAPMGPGMMGGMTGGGMMGGGWGLGGTWGSGMMGGMMGGGWAANPFGW